MIILLIKLMMMMIVVMKGFARDLFSIWICFVLSYRFVFVFFYHLESEDMTF